MFLQKLAAHIKEQYYDFAELTIVVPSERIRKYLWRELFKAYGKSMIAPEIITMSKWVNKNTPSTVYDKTRLLLELYQIYFNDIRTIDKSFDEFLNWGEILLSDFNEIDLYDLDPKQVFKNLADIKELESWQVDEGQLTESQKKFLEFWDKLPDYYSLLSDRLKEKEATYSGKAYKHLSVNYNGLFKEKDKRRFIFAGFNALSTTEMQIIKQLERLGRAEFLVDADEFYLKNKHHEAGAFLRKHLVDFQKKEIPFVDDKLINKELKVRIISCAQVTGQAKVAASELSRLSAQDLNETLLLLADESLINGVINNLPNSIEKANITLGLPLKNSAVKTWVETLFSIQENKARFNTDAAYHMDIKKLLQHPFILASIGKKDKKLFEIESSINKNNRIFVQPKNYNLNEESIALFELIFTPWNKDWSTCVRVFQELNLKIFKLLDSEFQFEKALVESFHKSLIEFSNIVEEGIPEMSLRSFKHLFNMNWQNRSIAYHGNPIEGLQIMGLLETRGLDFKNIICIGMNEGKLPPTNPIQTFLPMDLRRYLGLPTPREKQGIFAHHFYRLLHDCENLLITYSTAEDTLTMPEPSRYILQIEKELSRINPKIKLSKEIYTIDSNSEESYITSIAKTPEIKARMDNLFASSASPSMLKTFVTCPLDFYFKYIMEFGEAKEVEEEIESSTFGTFIHETLEDLYQPYAEFQENGTKKNSNWRPITSLDIEKMLKDYPVILEEKFLKHFDGDKSAYQTGKNYLSYQMAKDLLKKFLKTEIEFISQQTEPVQIIALEQSFEEEIEVEVFGTKKKVKLRGNIDRVDKIGNKVRVIDYKSGKVNESDTKYKSRSQSATSEEELVFESITGVKHNLQLLQYSYLYYAARKEVPEASIISFISNNYQPYPLNTLKFDLEEQVKNYPEFISMLLEQIYDEDVPFEHQVKGQFSFCNYCE